MKTDNENSLIVAILIPLAVGALSALLSGGMDTVMVQPAFAPPAILFPIVWTILYILMGISSYLIAQSPDTTMSDSGTGNKTLAFIVYALQLLFNFFWSIIFFGFSQYLFAFVWLLILIALIILMIYLFNQISPLAAYLQIPYLLWCIFAAVLNFAIYRLN